MTDAQPTNATYHPEATLEIDGQQGTVGQSTGNPLMAQLMNDILQISVEESLHLPGMFTIVIKNDYLPGRSSEQLWKYEKLLEIGKKVKISFRSGSTAAPEYKQPREGALIEGEITAIEAHFTKESQAPVIVRGYDTSHRLHRGRYNRSFLNMTDSDIVKRVAQEAGLRIGTIDSSGNPHDYVFQQNQTNMQFLRERASRCGFELFVRDGKLHFRKPQKNEETQELKWLENLHSFRVRTSTSEQVEAVEVRGWDFTKKEKIVSTANAAKSVITRTEEQKAEKSGKTYSGKSKMIVVNQPVFNKAEADSISQAVYDELTGEAIVADATANGNPKIRAGSMITLKEMGRYSGKYYVTETRHLYQKRVYSTEFSIRGLRGGTLFDLMSASNAPAPGQGFLVGVVTNNQDPQGWGRVKVRFPTLADVDESNWARVVAAGAGGSRGFDCLPEIDDEVLVGFEHGDIRRPYILGNVWNGKDAPPTPVSDSVAGSGGSRGKVRLRTFKTRVGHHLQFVEEDKGSSKAGVQIQTKYGHIIYLNDSDTCIEVKTKMGHKLRLDDKGQKIEIQTMGGHKVEMSDASRKVAVTSIGDIELQSVGAIKLMAGTQFQITTGGSMSVTSGSSLSMVSAASVSTTAPTVNISGAGSVGINGGFVRLNC